MLVPSLEPLPGQGCLAVAGWGYEHLDPRRRLVEHAREARSLDDSAKAELRLVDSALRHCNPVHKDHR